MLNFNYLSIYLILCLWINRSLQITNITSLAEVQTRINQNYAVDCFSDSYSATRDEYFKNKWADVISAVTKDDVNILVYPMCIRLFQLGNTLGYFFNEVACAAMSGAHFISVKKNFEIKEYESLITTGNNQYEFFNNLPDIIFNSKHENGDTVRGKVRDYCTCTQYCWENNNAPWLHQTEIIGEYVRKAIDAYLKVADTSSGTLINSTTDYLYTPEIKNVIKLPLIPDVAIQYRCGDNIGFGKTRYGLLPFYSMINIIKNSKVKNYIYVLADSPSRQLTSPYSSRCGIILQALLDNLKKHFPLSNIAIKRGGDQFLDYARLAYSPTTICSASTFCLWPALANNKGKVYFPLTPLIANSWDIATAANISLPQWNWITDAEIIKDFKQFRPWTAVINALETEPLPSTPNEPVESAHVDIQPINSAVGISINHKRNKVREVDLANDWKLPIFPSTPPSKEYISRPYEKNITLSHDKLVPRHLWIAVRNRSEELNVQMPGLFDRNPHWFVHIDGNEEKDLFMNETFANTSLLWAYHILSSQVGAAKADIWRYAVLWTYGGAYIDDDSDMKVPLDNVIEPLDSLIVSYEQNGFNGDRCYIPKYHLSDVYVYEKNETARNMNVFYGKILLNWAIISAPRHPIITRTIENLVEGKDIIDTSFFHNTNILFSYEVIHHQYINDPVLRNLNFAYKWAAVMCATGPSLMTASAREVVLANPDTSYKLARTDFKDYGGKFKAISIKVKDDPKHYMNMQNNKDMQLLSTYLPEKSVSSSELSEWEGTLVQGQNGKEIFVVNNGKKRGIPNYGTFLKMNFTMADVRVISDYRISTIELGELMPKLEG